MLSQFEKEQKRLKSSQVWLIFNIQVLSLAILIRINIYITNSRKNNQEWNKSKKCEKIELYVQAIVHINPCHGVVSITRTNKQIQ